ncbi:TadE/TadG family type IV pilus assembly protein [Parvibaculum sedimenti]|nr:TadE family protein [Parvibaculum sedimenti]
MKRPVCLGTSGAAAIEFALVVPLVLLFTIGIVDVGRLLWTQTTLDRAVQAAARCAAVNTTTCGSATSIKNYAVTQAYGMNIDSSAFTVSTGTSDICVYASLTFQLIIPWVGDTVNLAAKSCYPTS